MPKLNKIFLCGYMVAAPEVKHFGTLTIASFSLAVNESIKSESDPSGWESIAHFFDCKAFKSTAEQVEKWGGRGVEIIIEGRLVNERWEGKDGQKMSKTRIVVEKFQLVKYPARNENQNSDRDPYVDNIENGRPGNYTAPPINEAGDDIPF